MIILIATRHTENGLCNSNELCNIIESISPDVIFEEVPPAKFEGVYNGTRKDSLEVLAIKKYLQNHQLQHVPVDMDGDEIYERRVQAFYRKMSQTMAENDIFYRNVVLQQRLLADQYGFSYLNSKHCDELSIEKYKLETELLPNINHEDAFRMYNEWLIMNNKRENEMIRNIYNFSNQNQYRKGLFLVGAAHRKSLIEKISKFEIENNQMLNWVFNYFEMDIRK